MKKEKKSFIPDNVLERENIINKITHLNAALIEIRDEINRLLCELDNLKRV
jgi:hypothetical protein